MEKGIKMELEQTYTFRTDTGTQNENRALTLSALQRIIVVISEEHLENIGLDVPHLMREYGVSWILLSLSVDIKSPIRDGERLSVVHRDLELTLVGIEFVANKVFGLEFIGDHASRDGYLEGC